MGVFRKYRDKNGNTTGPWFIQYPVERDPVTGKIKYNTKRASWKKKKAVEILRQKQDDFYRKERLGIILYPDLTFSQLMDWGLNLELMKAKMSASDDGTRAKHLKTYFGSHGASQITPLMVEDFRLKMRHTISESTGKAYSGSTVNKMVSLARRIYYMGIDAGKVSANPFARRGMYREYPKGQHIPDEEFRKVYGFLPDSLKPMVLTAYLTGMRQGEILNLRWERVNLFQGFIDLTPADTKTKEPRYIFFSSLPELKKVFVEAARKRVSGHEIVFSQQDGSSISKWYLKRQFRKACETAKVGLYRFHDLRHTFNTNMVKAGVPEPVVMKLTGHKTLAMFLRYSHLDREQAEAAITKLDGLLSERKKQEAGSVQGSPKKEEREG